MDLLATEVKDYNVSPNNYAKTQRVDVWWGKQSKYPTLQKLARACLSIFHGPQVEGSFSRMKDIMKVKSGNMAVSTFSAVWTIKYSLMSRDTTAVSCFKRNDTLHTPINPALVNSMTTSHARYKRELCKIREEEEERKKDLDQQVHVLTTIAKAKSIKQHATKKAFKRHQSALGGPSKRRKY
ncbi:hypothetical protein PoB_005171100 [Plakobranchus ocellatus]|uniref:HAT C-terminal dimerisation domain-containing protein n=1 Tax=Plakobranchus ocellatus TaxID=259542 RepID=A0AAV4BXE6_9GAST|nr:hypothetical protein PoB_005171100 [Plakobranchus ocellatus]